MSIASGELPGLLARVNEILVSSGGPGVERVGDLIPLIQRLADERDEAVRKQRIANDKLVDLELNGVTGREQHGAEILQASLERAEAALARRDEEIRKLLTERERVLENAADEVNCITSRLAEERSRDQAEIQQLAERQRRDAEFLREEARKAEKSQATIRLLESQLKRLKCDQLVPALSVNDVAKLQDSLAASRRRIGELETLLNSQSVELDLVKLKQKSDGELLARADAQAEAKLCLLREQLESVQQQLADSESLNREMLRDKEMLVTSLEKTGRDAETLHAVLAAQRRQMDALRGEVAVLHSAVEEKGKSLAQVESQLEAARAAFSQREDLEETLQGLHQREMETIRLSTKVAALESVAGERETATQKLRAEIDARDSRLRALNATISDKDKEIEELRKRPVMAAPVLPQISVTEETFRMQRDLLAKVRYLESLLVQRDSQLANLGRSLDALKSTLADKEQEIAALNLTIDDYERVGSVEVESRLVDAGQDDADRERARLVRRTKESLAALQVVSIALTEAEKTVEELRIENSRLRSTNEKRTKNAEESVQTVLRAKQELSVQTAPGLGMQDHTSQTPSPAAKRDGVSQTVPSASRRDENSVQTTDSRMRLEARGVQTEAEFASEPVMDDEIPVVMESLLVEDILEQEAGGAEAEIRAMMADAGWDASEILGVDELARLVRQNVSRTLEYARDLELDIEFLRSQLESQLMRSEDANVVHQREIDRLDALLDSQIEMRKALQSSAVDLAEKTTQMWNKYGSRSKSLRSVLN